ncbi:KGG domain-containing protein [Janthinobacterium sp.]|uniref:KGG domain-containing protein n=1 Tax=Janthinobacterium sp. TaxID=1871054 RepID=UPI00293D2C94|nr:KGG domain-containing protein [Janthinobacterium sp.]
MASNQGSEQGKDKDDKQHAQKSVGGKRGFAAMGEEQQREIASKGGQAAHQKGTAHEFDSEEARRAGQKGGEVVSRDRAHMAEIGRKGGESRQSAHRDGKGAAASRAGVSEQQAKASRQGEKEEGK